MLNDVKRIRRKEGMKLEGQVYNVGILKTCLVLLAEFGGKGER